MNNRWNSKLILEEDDEDFDFRKDRINKKPEDRSFKTCFLAVTISVAIFIFGSVFLVGIATLVQWFTK